MRKRDPGWYLGNRLRLQLSVDEIDFESRNTLFRKITNGQSRMITTQTDKHAEKKWHGMLTQPCKEEKKKTLIGWVEVLLKGVLHAHVMMPPCWNVDSAHP